ncbi:MAG TPA: S24 family peptidase [Candidatus Polarisedimenticolia bacterium]
MHPTRRQKQILDGDYVVIEERPTARDGETVVALVNGAEATLKTLRRHRGKIELVPANSEMKPIEVESDRLRIQGVVTGLIRKYD